MTHLAGTCETVALEKRSYVVYESVHYAANISLLHGFAYICISSLYLMTEFEDTMGGTAQGAPEQLPRMAQDGIHAGFPSPATDYMTQAIDLNRELVRHPAATFYGRVVGDSMIDAGVDEGDILVIDRSLDPRDGDMAVCFVDGEFTLKYLRFHDGCLTLEPANEKYPSIEVDEGSDFKMWGVVTYIIKKTR